MSAAGLQTGQNALSQAQSALAGVVAGVGVITPTSGAWKGAEANVRRALDTFWKTKAADFEGSSPADQVTWTRLDVQAHRLWANLETQLQWTDAPGNIAAHGRMAQEILSKASALEKVAGDLSGAAAKAAARVQAQTTFTAQNRQDTGYSAAFRSQAKKVLGIDLGVLGEPFLGIPIWAWLGAGTVGLILWSKSR